MYVEIQMKCVWRRTCPSNASKSSYDLREKRDDNALEGGDSEDNSGEEAVCKYLTSRKLLHLPRLPHFPNQEHLQLLHPLRIA